MLDMARMKRDRESQPGYIGLTNPDRGSTPSEHRTVTIHPTTSGTPHCQRCSSLMVSSSHHHPHQPHIQKEIG